MRETQPQIGLLRIDGFANRGLVGTFRKGLLMTGFSLAREAGQAGAAAALLTALAVGTELAD